MTDKNVLEYVKDRTALERIVDFLHTSRKKNHKIIFYFRIYTDAVVAYQHYLSGKPKSMLAYVRKMERESGKAPPREKRYVRKIREHIDTVLEESGKKKREREIKSALKTIQGMCSMRILAIS